MHMISDTMNCIIIHGCPSDAVRAKDPEKRSYDKHWIPWTKDQLGKAGVSTETPLMPEPWNPEYERFKVAFEKCTMTKETILIGHSCGCAFLVRWLGDSKREIAKLILVAPWKIPDENEPYREAFYTYPIDSTIASRVGKIVIFVADNEEEDGKKSVQLFHDALGGEIIELKGRGHFTQGDMGTNEFPELIDAILKD